MAGENWYAKVKDNRLFLLNKSQGFQNEYKVNIVYKQQENVLIHIANDINKTTTSSFTCFLTQRYLNNNRSISHCITPSRVTHLSTLPHKIFSVLSPELRSDKPYSVSLSKGLDS